MNRGRRLERGLLTAAAMALLAPATMAAETPAVPAVPAKVEPELAPDKAILARIEALGENEALLLPKPRVVGEFNAEAKTRRMDQRAPGARDFCVKTVWAPDRKRALYCGGSYYNPINDVWEYDLAANTWALLYAPDPGANDPTAKEGVFMDEDGVLQTARGGPIHATHTWWGITYDPGRKMLLWINAKHRLHGSAKGYGFDMAKVYPGPQLWGYSPWSRKWEHQTAKGSDLPKGDLICVTLEYIPELKGSLMGTAWLYDSEEKQWKRVAAQVPENFRFPGERIACYDSRNKVLVLHGGEMSTDGRKGGRRTGHLDIASLKAEIVIDAQEDDTTVPLAHDNRTVLYYDPLSGHGLLYNFRKRNDKGNESGGDLWAYDAKTRKWTELKPHGPPPPISGFCGDPAYFDPTRNVFVVISADGPWVYRYKRASAFVRDRPSMSPDV